MTLIDNAVYVDGIRVATPVTLDEAYALQEAHQGFAWIGLYRPSDKELASVATEFDLHPLAIEDATGGHQRSKVERYGDTLFIVLRPARYDDEHERLDIGELHLFAGPDFIFAPTLIGIVYGMNFDVMPELHWEYGYPFALAVMIAFPTLLYVLFKRSRWL